MRDSRLRGNDRTAKAGMTGMAPGRMLRGLLRGVARARMKYIPIMQNIG
jgi:hypothetical protein